MKILTIQNCKTVHKRVFLRADLNVPLSVTGEITDDFRLISIQPTIDYLLGQQATIIIGTHMGRPTGIDPTLSTKHLIPWFLHHGYSITHQANLDATEHKPGTIVLLENLRFMPEEKAGSQELAQKLAQLADIYCNDAFGTMHRSDTSVSLLPQLFSPENRGIGLLTQRELQELDYIRTKPAQPFMMVLGGSKLEDKIPLISHFISKPAAQRPHTIMIGGALALPFILKSPETNALGQLAQQHNVTILLPTDLLIHEPASSPRAISSSQLTKASTCVDIGPATIDLFTQTLSGARSVFANGTMGIYENPAYARGTQAVLEALAASRGYTLVGGGDAAAATRQYHLASRISFISTGGGATLSYLGSSSPIIDMPGLKVLAQ